MSDLPLINNEDIDENVKQFWDIYCQHAGIRFQLSRPEYRALKTIIEHYHQASNQSSLEEFDGIAWAKTAGAQGLFSEQKAAYVFNVVMLLWHTQVDVSASSKNDWILLTLRSKTLQPANDERL